MRFGTAHNHSRHAIPSLHIQSFQNPLDLSHCRRFGELAKLMRDNKVGGFVELERPAVVKMPRNVVNHPVDKHRLPATDNFEIAASNECKSLMVKMPRSLAILEISLVRYFAQLTMMSVTTCWDCCWQLGSSNKMIRMMPRVAKLTDRM
jgi:hypothetical protein